METPSPSLKRREKDNGSASDRISQLPDTVLHHILCFLSQKKAVQTCVLSKSWRHLGSTRPVIDLRGRCRFIRGLCDYNRLHAKPTNGVCEHCFQGNKEAFISVLQNTFERYHRQNLFTQVLHLELLEDDSESISILEKWILIAFMKPTSVNSFRMSFAFGTCPDFYLPSVVFQAESLRELYLERCRLNQINSTVLTNLKKVSLHYVYIDGETLEKIMAGCPLVEYVSLTNCMGLKTFSIIANKNPYLKDFEYCRYPEEKSMTESMEIEVPTLQSIHIRGCSEWCDYHNSYFPNLKSLYLFEVKLSTDSFGNFSRNFFRLEELVIFRCYGFQEIKLSSGSIKRLTIKSTLLLKKVAIDVPNIIYFEISGWYVPTTFSLSTTSCREWTSHLYFSRCVDAYELIEMAKGLSHSRISLQVTERLTFKRKQIKGYPVVLEHLSLNIIDKFSPDSLGHLLRTLFHIFRPRYFNTKRDYGKDDDEAVTECVWKTLMHDREKREYGWEEHLEEVSIQLSDKTGKAWHHVHGTCFPEWSKDQKIRFRFKWRDLQDM